MAETKVYLPDSLDAQLREKAMKRFGYGRGSISRAVETAVTQWLATEDAIRGALDAVTAKAKDDRNVVAVIVFGSYARREPDFRDVDVALALRDPLGSDPLAYEEAVADRGALRSIKLEIQVLNDLPLDLQSRVLREGKVLYVRDDGELRAMGAEVAEKWNDFAPTLAYLTT
jgi:predicted nucleotidyltransferase